MHAIKARADVSASSPSYCQSLECRPARNIAMWHGIMSYSRTFTPRKLTRLGSNHVSQPGPSWVRNVCMELLQKMLRAQASMASRPEMRNESK